MGFWDFLTGKPSRDKFAKIMLTALQKNGVEGPFEYDAQTFSLRFEDHVLNLSNAFADYCQASRRDRARVLAAYLPIVTDDSVISDDFDEARPHLMPKVREPVFYDSMKLQSQIQGVDYPISTHKQLTPCHCVELAYDMPETVASIPNDQYDKWGITFDEALKIGRENLWKISKESFEQPISGFHVSPWHDSYDATRLFLHDLIWQLPVEGDHVVMTPSREFLMVAGSKDKKALMLMAGMARQLLEKETRPMHGHAVVLRDSQWSRFMPAPESAAFGDFRFLQLISHARDYEEQKSLLDQLHEKQSSDIFAASYSVSQNTKTGAYSCYSMWGEGIETLLPLTEQIVLMSDEGKTVHGFFAREKVEAAAGALLEKCGMTPERYRVKGFPSKAQIAAMGPNLAG